MTVEPDSIRIVEMPDLGAFTDSSSLVGERAGSGRFAAATLRSYFAADISACMAPVCAASTIATAVQQLGELGTLTSPTPALQFNITEAINPGASSFYLPIVVNARRTGGVGHRQAFTSQLFSNGALPSEMIVGGAHFAFIETGSGSVFGGNTYVRATAGAANTAAIVSFEANTDAQVTVKRKIGIQVVDVATSLYDGTDYCSALYIARQPGGLGWRDGIVFGDDITGGTRPASDTLIKVAATGGTTNVGIDFRTATFMGAAIALPTGANSGAINWGNGTGGNIFSDTAVNGPSLHFGNHGFTVVGSTGATALSLGTSPTPTVSIWVTGVGLRQITAGGADSGGAGLRTLCVPN